MAFAARNLSVLSYANGFTLWHYTTVDSLNDVLAANYFNDASDMLRKGDMIVTNANNSAAIENAVLFIGDVANGVVTLDETDNAE